MIITLAQVKAQLGLTDTTYDTQISAKIPIIDAKVKAICQNEFNQQFYATTKTGSNLITGLITQPIKDLSTGQIITGDGIPDGAYITDIYKGYSTTELSTPSIRLSEAATATATVYIYAGFNIAYHDVVSKGIWWMIDGTSTKINDTAFKSRSVGPLSISRSDKDNKIDGKSGMPAWFVKALPRWHR